MSVVPLVLCARTSAKAADKVENCSDSVFPPLKCSARSGANIFVTLHKVAVWNERLDIVYKT